MKIAIFSDIHSNHHALRACLKEAQSMGVTSFWVAGDLFGYYPWAVETFDLLKSLNANFIKGNHDLLVEQVSHVEKASYIEAAAHNREMLAAKRPEALSWLASLALSREFNCEGLRVQLCHGTPDEPVSGRYYPDDKKHYSWFPKAEEILILGHTHYPLERRPEGQILNPGSIGQPRDGNPKASWFLFDTQTRQVQWCRTDWAYRIAMRELEALNWNERAIEALNKDYPGPLRESFLD